MTCLSTVPAGPLAAAAGPQPPCAGTSAIPAFAPAGPAPNVQVWFADDFDGDWQPPRCTGWQTQSTEVLIATAGRFEDTGGSEAILARMAQVSAFTGIRYWSATRQIWRPLITEAYALEGPDRQRRRGDFTLDELQQGATLYFWQVENTPADEVIYRFKLRERSADRLVFALENANRIDFLLFRLFDPGEYQTLITIEHETGNVWRYYALQRAAAEIGLSTRGHRSSYVNRAAAMFRYLAGLPTDVDPPLAPE